ncbi:lipase member H-like [Planococcus citri]|uniref:lipase member H-like n=1 Tax=Planococcus citri TaxID=170843 RepID=UPI0031F92C84
MFIVKMITYVLIIVLTLISPSIEDDCPDPPTNCSRDNIRFFLYTDVNKQPAELFLNDPKTIKNAKFNKGNFKFMIHGFTQWKNEPKWITLREEYFKQKDKNWNILFLDYWPVAKMGCYWKTAVRSLEKIGECGANFLKSLLKERRELKIEQFHFIGFSLGAQICAQISNSLRPSKMDITRITGCDPAYPGFVLGARQSDTILNSQHATFVDVIHTNMGFCGVFHSSAHYDFYANDGSCQPGCKCSEPSCSHGRALQIYAESVNSKTKFYAKKCDSETMWISIRKCTGDHKATVEVGEYCKPPEKKDEGVYNFSTNDKSPFAQGSSKP